MGFSIASVFGNDSVRAVVKFAAQILWIVVTVSYVGYLYEILPRSEIGQLLFVLGMSEILAVLFFCSVGIPSKRLLSLRAGSEPRKMLVRIFVGISLLVAIFSMTPIPILGQAPFSVFVLLFATLVAALSHAICTRDDRCISSSVCSIWNAVLRAMVSFCLVFATSLLWDLDLDTILALHLLSALLCMIAIFPFCGGAWPTVRSHPEVGRSSVASKLRFEVAIGRYLDVVLAGWVLSASEAFIYLFARLFGLAVEATVRSFLFRMKIAMDQDNALGSKSLLRSSAARVNLGVLLVGGGAAIGVILIATETTKFVNDPEVMQVVFWVVGAASIPALCGATDLFMSAKEDHTVGRVLFWVMAVSTLGFASALDLDSAVDLARVQFIVSASFGVMSAIYVALRIGVLPGMTALLHKQIRLT